MTRWLSFVIGGLAVLTAGSGMLAVLDGDIARTVVLSMTITIALGLGFLSLESFLDERLDAAGPSEVAVNAPTAALIAMGCTAAVVMLALTVGLGSTGAGVEGPQVAGVQQLPDANQLRVFGTPRDARMVVRIDGQPVSVGTEAGLVEIPAVQADQEIEVLVLTSDDREAKCSVVLGDREVEVAGVGAATCRLD